MRGPSRPQDEGQPALMHGDVAQREERLHGMQKADGSIPSISTNNSGAIAQLGEYLPCKQPVVGSNPTGSTKHRWRVAMAGCSTRFAFPAPADKAQEIYLRAWTPGADSAQAPG